MEKFMKKDPYLLKTNIFSTSFNEPDTKKQMSRQSSVKFNRKKILPSTIKNINEGNTHLQSQSKSFLEVELKDNASISTLIPFEDYKSKMSSLIEEYKENGFVGSENATLNKSKYGTKSKNFEIAKPTQKSIIPRRLVKKEELTRIHKILEKNNKVRQNSLNFSIEVDFKDYKDPINSSEVLASNRFIFKDFYRNTINRSIFKIQENNKKLNDLLELSKSLHKLRIIPIANKGDKNSDPNNNMFNNGLKNEKEDFKKLIKLSNDSDIYFNAAYSYCGKNFPECRDQFSMSFDPKTEDVYIFGGISTNKNNLVWSVSLSKFK